MTDIDLDALEATARAATIPDAPGYLVRESGEIVSVGHDWRGYGERVITPVEGKSGYLKVRLSVAGRRINRAVHRLVAEAYLPPRPPGSQVRHLDGDKRNNSASNLAWGTSKDNAEDRDKHRTTARGSRIGTALIDEERVREVRRLKAKGLLNTEIARETGVSISSVSKIIRKVSWSHVD